jgi:hypothetical protein
VAALSPPSSRLSDTTGRMRPRRCVTPSRLAGPFGMRVIFGARITSATPLAAMATRAPPARTVSR